MRACPRAPGHADGRSEKVLARGYILISANYRLLYPSSAQDLIDDTHTVFSYLGARNDLTAFLASHALAIDLHRVVVFGNSGGNYLARAAATLPTVQPRPVAWISVNGMAGDFVLDHWVQPKDKVEVVFLAKEQDKVDALLAHGGGPVSTDASLKLIPELRQAGDATGRVGLFVHWQHQGTLLDYLLDEPGMAERIRSLPLEQRASAIPSSKKHLLLPLNTHVPPTFAIHGTSDTVVPFAESERTHLGLEALGVRTELGAVDGADHGLRDPSKPPPARRPGWEEAVERGLDFMDECVRDVCT